jgi:hypothetical protein
MGDHSKLSAWLFAAGHELLLNAFGEKAGVVSLELCS